MMGGADKQRLPAIMMGRWAGKAAGLTGQELGRITMLSYVLGNPLISVIAARSMAKKRTAMKHMTDTSVGQGAPSGLVEQSGDMPQLLAQAIAARDEAKLAAVKAGTEAVKAADSAKEAGVSATLAGDSAKQAALTVSKPS